MIEQKINLGLFGLGTVGSSVVKILSTKNAEFKQNYGLELNLKKIAVKRINVKRKVSIARKLLTTSLDEILNDPEIDTIIELIGGTSPAKEIILKALKNKKNVVTGNKYLLAIYGDKLIREARKNNCYLGFRAAITGCHQLLNHLAYSGSIKSIVGIFNGTCNHILTEMEKTGKSFKEALEQAQRYGYAEKDPSMDIEGIDTAHKVMIITRLVFGLPIKITDFHVEGIQNIDIRDIHFVKELGYQIKLLGIIKREDNNLEIRVHPSLVPKDKNIAMLKGIENGIQINDDLRGPSGLYAEGAGGNPTASAVITDLMDIANARAISWPKQISSFAIKRMSLVKCKYYMRFNAINKPGVLSRISSVLGKSNINIKNVIQKGDKLGAVVPVIIITDEAFERDIQKALKLIDNLAVVKDKTKIIRIEENVY
jgi:homoserine dehydrogenase